MQKHIRGEIRDIPGSGIGTTAYWSVDVASESKSVVFVHGFWGDPLESWIHFDRLLPFRSECGSHDLIFYGYDALRPHASESGENFYIFLKTLCASPQTVFEKSFPSSMKRSKSFQYKGVILVAHSLGAVVCRLALLAANARNDGWASKVRMVLFAPAHCGTKSIGWISSAVTGLNLPPLNLALTILRSRFKVADDLMFDSPVIEQLRKDTEQAFERGSVDYLRAAKVVWAQNDDVVINGRFVRDPAPDSFEKSHRAVCKPSYDYLNPVEQVIEILLQ